MANTPALGFRLDEDATAALVRAAKADSRPVGALIRLIVVRWLVENGHLQEDKPDAG
jgi:hypothetical protein